VLIFNIWDNFLNASNPENSYTQNKLNFKKLNNNWLGKTWVAITTNVWISYKQLEKLPSTIYREIFSLEEIIWNIENSKGELIWKNMITIKEYLNVLKTDPKKLINSSNDKPQILNAYIDQLEFRYQTWVELEKKLIEQNNIFLSRMQDVSSKIEILKDKIASDFKNNDSEASLKDIDEYLELKKEFYHARIYMVYISHFIKQYHFLNNYAKNLATILISNKEAIIKDAYVVIPKNGWLGALKQFDLIYEEEKKF
jgi:hypothetical protein